MEQAADFHKRKEEAKADLKEYKKEKKKEEKKEEKKKEKEEVKEVSTEEEIAKPTEVPKEESKPEPVEVKERPKPKRDVTKLNAFKEKVIKEFGLTESLDANGCTALKFEGFLIMKLLPRANCWYGVWREDPAEGNKWRAFRVWSEKEETETYNHIKEFVKVNSE